jgi:hypothetical protein
MQWVVKRLDPIGECSPGSEKKSITTLVGAETTGVTGNLGHRFSVNDLGTILSHASDFCLHIG